MELDLLRSKWNFRHHCGQSIHDVQVCTYLMTYVLFLLFFQLIHLTWSPGIKSKQTLADDERSVSVVLSLKLYGSPWSQAVYNSGKATIQAR